MKKTNGRLRHHHHVSKHSEDQRGRRRGTTGACCNDYLVRDGNTPPTCTAIADRGDEALVPVLSWRVEGAENIVLAGCVMD